MRKLILGVIITLLSLSTFAQNPYIKSNSIGKVEAEKTIKRFGPLKYRTLEETIGETFMLLPKSKSLQGYGYSDVKKKKGSPYAKSMSYEEGVGKMFKLESVDQYYGYFRDDKGEEYKIRKSLSTSFSDMAIVSELDSAKKMFVGKTLWPKKAQLITYDEEKNDYGKVEEVRASPVKVLDIAAGWNNYSPIRFILQADNNQVGYLEVNLSGSNCSEILREFYSFDNIFWEVDPKKLYSFSDEIWGLIKKSKVRIGMTKEQVILSWGEPTKINKSINESGVTEQWVYGKNDPDYLYFDSSTLKSMN